MNIEKTPKLRLTSEEAEYIKELIIQGKKIDEIYLPNGKYSINYSYSGGGLFGARFYNQLIQSSPYHTVLSLERKNNINETHVIEGSFENACIDVECYGGEWSITIDRIGE